jgi:hypothetical protein
VEVSFLAVDERCVCWSACDSLLGLSDSGFGVLVGYAFFASVERSLEGVVGVLLGFGSR